MVIENVPQLKYCVWVTAVMLICAQPHLAQTTATPSVVNLREYDWEPPEPIHPHEIDTPGTRSIVIDHKSRILVGFTVKKNSGLVTRDNPAFSYHVVRFTPNGKVNLSLSLPANGWRNNSLYLSDTDQIIVRANDKLQLLQSGPDLKPENISWKVMAACALRCRIIQSPSRRTLLLYAWDVNPPVTVFDLAQFPNAEQCEKPPYPVQAITDKFAYYTGQNRQLQLFSYRWPLCDYNHHVEMPIHLPGNYAVLNDESFVTDIDFKTDKYIDNHLYVISSDGHPKFKEAMAKHERWAPIRGSEQGNRIAVDMLTERGGNQRLDLSAHLTARRIVVYDINIGKELASIPINLKHHYEYEFDFSPDGHRLAILEDDIVKVVDIE
ncbi:MAG TPA: hypothetical protein VGK24_05190 [Candidatus Angelobacter sp.]|jgi:hypothetical protein